MKVAAKDTESAPGPHQSMTGFASHRGAAEGFVWVIEVRSVNARGLDLRLRMPDWIDGLEPEVRKRLQGAVSRGTISLNVKLQADGGGAALRLSEQGLGAALETLKRIEAATSEAGVSLRPTSAAEIALMRGVAEAADVTEETSAALKKGLLSDIDDLILDFVADRTREGQALTEIIAAQIERVEALATDARAGLGDRAEAARESIKRALARLTESDAAVDEGRLAQELALIAVKTDVAEELDRLDAHITAARALLAENGPVGRKFDFLIQEFNREANTLCSKAQSGALTAIGLDLKAVIDQMREQVQNLE